MLHNGVTSGLVENSRDQESEAGSDLSDRRLADLQSPTVKDSVCGHLPIMPQYFRSVGYRKREAARREYIGEPGHLEVSDP